MITLSLFPIVGRSAVTALAVVIGGGGGGGGVLVSAAAAVAGEVVVVSRCRFPASWKGQYFQSGLGIIIIKDSLMTTKGECVDHNRDYFLIDNRWQRSNNDNHSHRHLYTFYYDY